MENKKIELSQYRMNQAKETLTVARDCVEGNHYKDSINRSYYAAFYAIKAVQALSEIDFKRHKDARLQQKREKSDYDDFYIASKDEAFEQIETAEMIINAVEVYLTSKNKSDSI